MPYEWRRLVHDTHSKPNMVPPITVFSKKQGMCLDLRSLKSKDINWILFDTHFESIKPRCIEKWSDYIQPDEKPKKVHWGSPLKPLTQREKVHLPHALALGTSTWYLNMALAPTCQSCATVCSQ